jgi:hypothetical protein
LQRESALTFAEIAKNVEEEVQKIVQVRKLFPEHFGGSMITFFSFKDLKKMGLNFRQINLKMLRGQVDLPRADFVALFDLLYLADRNQKQKWVHSLLIHEHDKILDKICSFFPFFQKATVNFVQKNKKEVFENVLTAINGKKQKFGDFQ